MGFAAPFASLLAGTSAAGAAGSLAASAALGAGINALSRGGSGSKGASAPRGAGDLTQFAPRPVMYADPTGGDYTQTALNMAGQKYQTPGTVPTGPPAMVNPDWLLNGILRGGGVGPNGWRTGILGSDFQGMK